VAGVDYDTARFIIICEPEKGASAMTVHRMPARLLILALTAMVLLAACNQEPSDSAPSEVPASAPMDSSASS